MTRSMAPATHLISLRSASNVENGVSFDRLVLEFSDGLPGYRAQYVDQVVRPGSGAPLALRGQKEFELVLTPAVAHDDQGTSTLRTAPNGGDQPELMSYAVAGDYEGNVHIGIGLAGTVDFRIVELTGPDRIAIDFRR